MRAFVAIEVPEEARATVEALIERLRVVGRGVTWVRMDHMHLTLRFLGEIDHAACAQFAADLAARLQGRGAIELRVTGVGAFPSLRRPSVLWVGAKEETGLLDVIQREAELAAQAAGIAPESKRFHPHLTLGRVKDPEAGRRAGALLEAEPPFDAGAFCVEQVVLFESTLTPRGPIYRRVQEFSLI